MRWAEREREREEQPAKIASRHFSQIIAGVKSKVMENGKNKIVNNKTAKREKLNGSLLGPLAMCKMCNKIICIKCTQTNRQTDRQTDSIPLYIRMDIHISLAPSRKIHLMELKWRDSGKRASAAGELRKWGFEKRWIRLGIGY